MALLRSQLGVGIAALAAVEAGLVAAPSEAQGDSWRERAPMRAPRRLLAAAAEGGRLYTFGGCGSACFQPPFHTSTFEETRVEVYNPGSNTWTVRQPIPAIVYGAAAAAVDGRIYLFGGYLTGNVTLEYDPATDSWTRKAPMPTARFGLAAVAVGGSIYVLGGGGPSGAVEIYDPAIDAWRRGASMPTARVFLGAAVVNGKIVAVGGSPDCCGQAVTDAVEVYDPASDSWTRAAPLPVAQQTSAVQAANGKVYVLGGFIPGLGAQGATYEYDPATNSWQARAPLLTPRDQAPAVLIGNEIFLVGGSVDCHCQALDENEGYTPSRSDLSITKTDEPDAVCPRDPLRYTITVRNGRAESTSAVVEDVFATALTKVSWTCTASSGSSCTPSGSGTLRDSITLAAQGEAVYSVGSRVALGTKDAIENTARLLAPSGVLSAMERTRIRGDLGVKITSSQDSVAQGGQACYEVSVDNEGGPLGEVELRVTTTGGASPVTPSDPRCSIAGEGFSCALGEIAANGSVPPSELCFQVPHCGACPTADLEVTAEVSTANPECSHRGNEARAITRVECTDADLALESFEVIAPCQCGGEIAYRAEIVNHGPGTASDALFVQTVPAGLTLESSTPVACAVADGSVLCPLGDLAKDGAVTLETRFAVPAGCPETIESTATVSSTAHDCDSGNDSRTVEADCSTDDCDLQIAKTAAVSSACPGELVDYTITVVNDGTCFAKGAVVKDPCPAGLDDLTWCRGAGCLPIDSCPLEATIDLPAGAAEEFRLRGTASPLVLGTLPNTATVEPPAGFDDMDPANNSATAEVTVAPCPCVNAYCVDLSGAAMEGSAIVKTYLLLNGGPAFQADNPGDEFTDVLPGTLTLVSAAATSGTAATAGNTVTWNGSIPPGGSVTLTITATINLGTAGMEICNDATVLADCDGNGSNESSRGSVPCCFVVLDPELIPALSGWALGALVLLLAAFALYRLQRRKDVSPP